MVFGLKKKNKDVPDQLPDLIYDEILDDSDAVLDKSKKDSGSDEKAFSKADEAKNEDKGSHKMDKVIEDKNGEEGLVGGEGHIMDDSFEQKSFFSNLFKEINEGVEDLDILEQIYDKKLSSNDIIEDMKSHWKDDSILKVMGKYFREKIESKTNELKVLEKEWQEMYFELVEKEEKLREEERELKKILGDFVEVYKGRKKSFKGEHPKGSDEKKDSGKEEERK